MPRAKGPLSASWKGGRTITDRGYVLIKVGTDHHLADVRGYAYEHRLVAEQKIGRRLKPGEHVHHIDHNTQNNAPENLQVTESAWHHMVMHRRVGYNRRKPEDLNSLIKCACGCSREFNKFDSMGRPRKYIRGHNPSIATRESEILRMLATGPQLRSYIISMSNGTKHAVATELSRLKRKGLASNKYRGRWEITDSGRRVYNAKVSY